MAFGFGSRQEALRSQSTFRTASSKPGIRLNRTTVGFVATISLKRPPPIDQLRSLSLTYPMALIDPKRSPSSPVEFQKADAHKGMNIAAPVGLQVLK